MAVSDATHSNASLLVVARRPRSSPATASSAAPVHTLNLCCALTSRTQDTSAAFLISVRVPRPPTRG